MSNNKLTATSWNDRYCDNNIPWDIGYVSPALKKQIDLLENKEIRILIPGAGSAHEAVYLHQLGFQNVWVCDWAEDAFHSLKTTCPDFPKKHLLVNDFFELDLEVDLIIEQTFFCAISPNLRPRYVKKVAELLNIGGRLMGLLFGIEFKKHGPPFGGTKEEYLQRFSPLFDIIAMEVTEDSITPRLGNELFIDLKKKK